MSSNHDVAEANRLEPLLIELFQELYAQCCAPDLAKNLARAQAAALRLIMRGSRDKALRMRRELYGLAAEARVSRQVVQEADASAFLELASLCRARYRTSPRLLEQRTSFLHHAVATFLPEIEARQDTSALQRLAA